MISVVLPDEQMLSSAITVFPLAGHEQVVLIAVRSTPPLQLLLSVTLISTGFNSSIASLYQIPEPAAVSVKFTLWAVVSVMLILAKSPCVTVTTIWNSSFAKTTPPIGAPSLHSVLEVATTSSR